MYDFTERLNASGLATGNSFDLGGTTSLAAKVRAHMERCRSMSLLHKEVHRSDACDFSDLQARPRQHCGAMVESLLLNRCIRSAGAFGPWLAMLPGPGLPNQKISSA